MKITEKLQISVYSHKIATAQQFHLSMKHSTGMLPWDLCIQPYHFFTLEFKEQLAAFLSLLYKALHHLITTSFCGMISPPDTPMSTLRLYFCSFISSNRILSPRFRVSQWAIPGWYAWVILSSFFACSSQAHPLDSNLDITTFTNSLLNSFSYFFRQPSHMLQLLPS